MEKHILPELPYGYGDLEPYIDETTMKIHHTKHHQTYVDKLNAALEKHPDFFKKNVDELISDLRSVPEDIRIAVRNHGGGHSNHSFFWKIMSPKKQEVSGAVKKEIEKKFGSFDEFKKLFSDVAVNRFGSGWAWLILNKGELEIVSTMNQDSPLNEGQVPLLAIDVWEHAYYLKYQNKRADYVSAFFNVINWKKVEELFEKARE